MTRFRLILSPDPDRDLPDPGEEVKTTCNRCGCDLEDERSRYCLDCYYGPDEDSDDTADEDHRAVHEHD